MNWKQIIFRKLTSRKFWMGVAGMAAGLVMVFGYADSDAETIAGAILAAGSALGYMMAEGIPDAMNVGNILEAVETIYQEIKDGKDDEQDGETDTECSD